MHSTVVALGFAILAKPAFVGLTLSMLRPHLVPFLVPNYMKWFRKTPEVGRRNDASVLEQADGNQWVS